MSHVLSLSDEIYQQLAAYAAAHHRTPEEVLASLVQGLATGPSLPEIGDAASVSDPWEGFYGSIEVNPADAIARHDEMIAREALERHDDGE